MEKYLLTPQYGFFKKFVHLFIILNFKTQFEIQDSHLYGFAWIRIGTVSCKIRRFDWIRNRSDREQRKSIQTTIFKLGYNIILGDGNESGLPHPLPMPEFGGWFAPLTEFLPDPSYPIASFHRSVISLGHRTGFTKKCACFHSTGQSISIKSWTYIMGQCVFHAID